MQSPRYLVPFDTRRLPRLETEVLVIGSGIAGLRLAIEAAEQASVLLLTKAELVDSNSDMAQGGIAAAIGASDSFEAHTADTMRAGDGLCERGVVERIVEAGPAAIERLISWGTHFDCTGAQIDLTREGGHSQERVLHARGDSTGAEIISSLIARAEAVPRLRILEHTFAIDLVTHPDGGRCLGALVFTRHGEFQFVSADVTVLATGGAGQLYRETTNPEVATGDGLAMAYRAGAELGDLEFVQFHPTTLYIAGSARTLISEAVRGEGGLLRNAAGERFMPAVHEAAELAPRDVVSRAIVQQIKQTGETTVYLDLTHLDAEHVKQRFPRIAEVCHNFHLDISREMIPVRPSAHYMVGGVRVDLAGRTSIPGLLACGEVSCTGLHGANRMGSNSLLEGLVTGELAAAEAVAEVGRRGVADFEDVGWRGEDLEGGLGAIDMTDLQRSLRSSMWRHVGIERSAVGLGQALRQFDFWGRYIWRRTFFRPAGWSLQNMLMIGEAIARAAIAREESRGVHFRSDFPGAAPRTRHSLVCRDRAEIDWVDLGSWSIRLNDSVDER